MEGERRYDTRERNSSSIRRENEGETINIKMGIGNGKKVENI
jgi:hypothetical protein